MGKLKHELRNLVYELEQLLPKLRREMLKLNLSREPEEYIFRSGKYIKKERYYYNK